MPLMESVSTASPGGPPPPPPTSRCTYYGVWSSTHCHPALSIALLLGTILSLFVKIDTATFIHSPASTFFMHSEIEQLGKEPDKGFLTFKDTRCCAVGSTLTTAPTDTIHCHGIISTIAVSVSGTTTLEARPKFTCTTSSHITDTQPNKTTDTNESLTGKLGIGNAALEFSQTHLVTSLLATVALLVVFNWLFLSHRRISLEGQNHREEMSVRRLELYSKTHPQTSVGIRTPDEDLLRAGISPYTLYENRMPQWSFAKLRLWWGSTDRIEIEQLKAETERLKVEYERLKGETERLKAETARIRNHGLRLEADLELVKRSATWCEGEGYS
ncbi:hypothetical protein BGX38DRAFT_1213516 [Terfezia claveryi]|nr:hypothetical protein BGX38DRAFT_1213516 [Terfezia claveryi]